MKKNRLCILVLAALSFSFHPANNPWQSKYVKVNEDGSLRYIPDDKGNIIPDFSRVGYHQGDRPLPKIPAVIAVSPAAEGSSQEIIQQAIDKISKRKPDENGFRGAVLLKNGRYNIPGSIRINAGGIVLRGEGKQANGTVLVATGRGQRTLVSVSGAGEREEIPGTRREITDDYVPVGAKSFELASVSGLQAGDQIVLFRPGTQQWISDLKMDQIQESEDVRQWRPEEYNLHFERSITKIEGKRVFIDNPVVMPIDRKYGGGAVYKYVFEGRIGEVGIEDISLESEFRSETDEDHGWIAIEFDKTRNAWVRNITACYFGYAAVSLGEDTKQITVTDSESLEPKSQITGGRRYSFNNNGQLNLFKNLLSTEGRHDYITGSQVLGPNVFYNCRAKNAHSDIGPHHRWAVGTLFDNVVTDGEINVQDRGDWGSGHGWAGVTQVIWGCTASSAAVQSPWVSGENYCIGLMGDKSEGRLSNRPEGVWEGKNRPGLIPNSLYKAQLKARKEFQAN